MLEKMLRLSQDCIPTVASAVICAGPDAALVMVVSVIPTEEIMGLGSRTATELFTAGSATQTATEFIGGAVSR